MYYRHTCWVTLFLAAASPDTYLTITDFVRLLLWRGEGGTLSTYGLLSKRMDCSHYHFQQEKENVLAEGH